MSSLHSVVPSVGSVSCTPIADVPTILAPSAKGMRDQLSCDGILLAKFMNISRLRTGPLGIRLFQLVRLPTHFPPSAEAVLCLGNKLWILFLTLRLSSVPAFPGNVCDGFIR